MIKHTSIVTALLTGVLALGGVTAASSQTLLEGLPDGHHDSLSIRLGPSGGSTHGAPGAITGWGFTINWSSDAGDWIQFTGSSLGAAGAPPTNPSILASGGYTDYIGRYGGPYDVALPPTYGQWVNPFIPGAAGLGLYPIAADAVAGAVDTGQIVITFQVYNGDPLKGGTRIGNAFYTYAGPDTAYVVAVDPPPTTAQQIAGLCASVQNLPISGTLQQSLCGTLQPPGDDAKHGHRGGDGCDHDRGVNGHHDGDGCDHDKDVLPVGRQCELLKKFVKVVSGTPTAQLPAAFATSLLNQTAGIQYTLGCKP